MQKHTHFVFVRSKHCHLPMNGNGVDRHSTVCDGESNYPRSAHDVTYVHMDSTGETTNTNGLGDASLHHHPYHLAHTNRGSNGPQVVRTRPASGLESVCHTHGKQKWAHARAGGGRTAGSAPGVVGGLVYLASST